MKRLAFLAALALAGWLSHPAHSAEKILNWGITSGSQPRSVCAYDTTNNCVSTGLLNATTHKSSPLYPIDVRVYGAVCNGASSTGVATAVNAAVSAGWLQIFLPKNCTYIPTANITPANVTIIGEDWRSSVVSSADPTTDYLGVGPYGELKNVDVISKAGSPPCNLPNDCPIRHYMNLSGSSSVVQNYPNHAISVWAGAGVTPGGQVVADDVPGIGVLQSTAGDGFYAATLSTAGGAGYRAATAGGGDSGVFIQNGVSNPANVHHGIYIVESGTANVSSHSIEVDRRGNVGAVVVNDAQSSAGSFDTNIYGNVWSKQTGGSLISLFQNTAGSAYTGPVMNFNMANGGATFAGNLISYINNGATLFQVGADGSVIPQWVSLPARAAPSAPASGWVIYTDSGDSNKLKAKASNGTTITIGTP